MAYKFAMSISLIAMSEKSVGRPRKFKEELEKREIMFPASLSQQLDQYVKAHKKTMADVVREAVVEKISSSASNIGVTGIDELKGALREVLKEDLKQRRRGHQQYTFDLIDDDAKELEKLAAVFHIEDPQIFVKVLTNSALDAGPAAVRELLYGQFDADVDEFVAAKESAVKPKKVARKVA